MESIHQDKQRRIVKEKEEIKFSSFSSFHLIIITARARSEKQISKQTADDEELTVTADDKTFPKLETKEALLDSPASFNGGKLHNFSKTVYFLTFLKGKNHIITLKTDEPHNTSTFERLEIYTLSLEKTFTLNIKNQAEDGNRRPWITFVLDNLPLKSTTPTITYSRRKRDSDDVKVIIDGQTQGNLLRTIKHFLWKYVGSRIDRFSSKTETETFTVNLPQGLHYVEFDADRRPTLQKITFNFGTVPPLPKGIPTGDHPKWTGSFSDDTEVMLLARIIFGESRNQPKETKVGVGWAVKNRIGKGELIHPRKVHNTYHDVILDEGQYASLTDSNVRPRLEDPLNTDDPGEKKAWYESYEVATEVISGRVPDPTGGALFFHDDSMTQDEFLEVVPRALYITTIGRMLFYRIKP